MTFAERFEYTILNIAAFLVKIKFFSTLAENKKAVILCFHSVGDDKWRFSVNRKMFETQIKYLAKNKNVVSLDDILSRKGNDKNKVAITFDDGYKNWYTNVLPICQKYNITGTIFLLGDPNNADRSELKNNLPLLKKHEILGFLEAGWEIGSHTMTHSDLRNRSYDKLIEEITFSKKILEQNLGIDVKYLAYPRGIYSNQVLDLVKKSGYKAAFTINGGYADLSQLFLINRVSLEGKLSLSQFMILVSDFGIQFYWYFMKVLKFKEHMLFQINEKKKQFGRDLGLLIVSPIEYLYSFKDSNSQKAKIWPYNPIAKKIADEIVVQIKTKLINQNVHLIGSTLLMIPGDKDIDIVVESNIKEIKNNTKILIKLFGPPIKTKKDFVEWNFKKDDYSIEVILTHSQSRIFKVQIRTFNLLKSKKEWINEYCKIKTSSDGLSAREYQRRRIEFFNRILKQQKNSKKQKSITSFMFVVLILGTILGLCLLKYFNTL